MASLSKQERQAYDENLRKYRDTIAVMEGQYLEGIAKGIEKGIAKGIEKGIVKDRTEGFIATARKMKADGLSTELITKYTGLSAEEIAAL